MIYHRRFADGQLAERLQSAGAVLIEGATENLRRFAAKIDTEKTKPPAALTVITGNGFAHRRADGVNVVPLSVLTA